MACPLKEQLIGAQITFTRVYGPQLSATGAGMVEECCLSGTLFNPLQVRGSPSKGRTGEEA